MTSSSNSPQPSTDSSMRIWPIGEAAIPRAAMRRNSSSVRAMPPPWPPRVKAGRTMIGSPISIERGLGLLGRGGDRAARHAQTGAGHRLAEAVAVLGPVDRVVVGADQLDAVALERAVVVEHAGEVQRRPAAEGGQQRVRALLGDDLRDRPGQQRLDVGRGGELRVGHDRRRVGVDEDDLVALVHQDLAGLRARVVELGRLPDHDRPRADQHDAPEVVPTRHRRSAPGTGRRGRASRAGRGRPRGGTGRSRRGRRAGRGPRRCGRRG